MERRDFLRLASLAPLAVVAKGQTAHASSAFAYLGADDSIQVFSVEKSRFTRVHEFPCAAPSALIRHPTLPVLYATNEIDNHHGRPTGTITVFRSSPDGMLAPLQTRELSLSATHPRSMAISPDGSSAIVAASGGGIYILFAIGSDGTLGALRGIVKETGCGPHPQLQTTSRPQHVCFDQAGHALGADPGTDRIHVLSAQSHALPLDRRYQTEDGSGPARITLHREAPFLAVSHELKGNISIHPYDAANGLIGPPQAILQGTVVPLDTESSFLAVQDGPWLTVHRWARSGKLRKHRQIKVGAKVQSAQLHPESLTYTSSNQARRLHLADGTDSEIANCPGLRCIVWPTLPA